MRILISTLLLLLLPLSANGVKIVASTSHIASIASMIVDDVEVIAGCSSCPAHYSLKPSDIEKIKSADLILYIDDKFEPFAEVLKHKSDGKLIKISALEGVNIRKGNYHIWLDIDVAKKIVAAIGKELELPTENALNELNQLSVYKSKILSEIKHPVLLSDSLEYLFDSPDRLYYDLASINIIRKIETLDKDVELFADAFGNFAHIEEKTARKITYLASEKWPNNNYIGYYKDMLDKVIGNGSIQNTTHK